MLTEIYFDKTSETWSFCAFLLLSKFVKQAGLNPVAGRFLAPEPYVWHRWIRGKLFVFSKCNCFKILAHSWLGQHHGHSLWLEDTAAIIRCSLRSWFKWTANKWDFILTGPSNVSLQAAMFYWERAPLNNVYTALLVVTMCKYPKQRHVQIPDHLSDYTNNEGKCQQTSFEVKGRGSADMMIGRSYFRTKLR